MSSKGISCHRQVIFRYNFVIFLRPFIELDHLAFLRGVANGWVASYNGVYEGREEAEDRLQMIGMKLEPVADRFLTTLTKIGDNLNV